MISVVIPVYNQAKSLEFVLEGFEKQTYSGDFNIIVVDDGSEENIGEIVERFEQLNIDYVRQENRGRAAARNLGAKHVFTDFVVFCDADRIPSPDFIQKYNDNFLRYPECISIGIPKELYISDYENKRDKVFETVKKDGIYAKEAYYSKIIKNLYDDNGICQSSIPWISTLSGNMGLSLKKFNEVNGFDEDFEGWGFEHFEFGYRLFRNQVKFVRLEGAINYHLPHARSMDFYKEEIARSHSYFYNKYQCAEVFKLKDFMLGELSLQDYEAAVNNTSTWIKKADKPLYNRILNF